MKLDLHDKSATTSVSQCICYHLKTIVQQYINNCCVCRNATNCCFQCYNSQRFLDQWNFLW